MKNKQEGMALSTREWLVKGRATSQASMHPIVMPKMIETGAGL
jgi:hypothetical protein